MTGTWTQTVRAAAAVVALGLVAGCGGSGGAPAHRAAPAGPAVHVDHRQALADAAVRVRVSGLKPHQRVGLSLGGRDKQGGRWGSSVTARADAHGGLELRKPMELFSTMLPRSGPSVRRIGSGNAFSYHPGSPAAQGSYRLRLSVRAGDRTLAATTLTREWLRPGATHRRLTVARDGVDGVLYNPPKGSPRGAPVLVFGGSEGGNAGDYAAALLASHGHPAAAVCYFRCGSGSGRPNAIDMIDLGYFVRAAHLLQRQPAAASGRTAVMGNSRGSEAAQLLGERYPKVFRDVIAYAPSSKVIGPYPTGTAAWADHGRPIPVGPIPLSHVRGQVFAIAGSNDKMWGSAASARAIAAQRGAHGARHRERTYAGAGHHVNWFPYAQPGQDGGADGNTAATSRADQRAREDGWPRVLAFLDR